MSMNAVMDLHTVMVNVSSGEPHFPDSPYESDEVSKIEIPDDVYFTSDLIPVKGAVSSFAPYGDFTVYVAVNGKKYHADKFCGSGFYKPAHIYDVSESKYPCLKCALNQRFDRRPPEWYIKAKVVADEIRKTSPSTPTRSMD